MGALPQVAGGRDCCWLVRLASVRRAVLALAAVGLLHAGIGLAGQEAPGQTPLGPPPGIKISFRLDPRLTLGQYMGEHWVSSSEYTSTASAGGAITVEARVQGLDASRTWVNVSSEWTPEDPAMVTVAPSRNHQVKVSVKRAGKSSVVVVAAGHSTRLLVVATLKNNALQAVISQEQ